MPVDDNASPREAIRPFALQFLRRVDAAFYEYALAREKLLRFVSGERAKWSPYYRTLYHFEAALGQLYQAHQFGRCDRSYSTRVSRVSAA